MYVPFSIVNCWSHKARLGATEGWGFKRPLGGSSGHCGIALLAVVSAANRKNQMEYEKKYLNSKVIHCILSNKYLQLCKLINSLLSSVSTSVTHSILLCKCFSVHHRWQTQGLRAESGPPPCSIWPGTLFVPHGSAELSINCYGVVTFIPS